MSVRRAWLRDLLKRKTAPAGAARFVTEATIRGDHAVRRAFERSHPLASELFGVEGAAGPNKYGFGARTGDLLTLLDGASDKRLNGITLGLLLAAYEDGLDRDSWRGNVSATNSRYLQFLADNGYPLCDVERLAAGLPPTEVASSENSKEESGEVQRVSLTLIETIETIET